MTADPARRAAEADPKQPRVLSGVVPATAAGPWSLVDRSVADRCPNFFVLGAIKTGTTSLHAYLGQHPQIFMPRLKELGFFQIDDEFSRGLSYLARQHYRSGAGSRARGDATPTYLYNEFVAERIEATLPRTSHRFIVLLRDPVQRAYSAYLHMVRLGLESENFERGLELEPLRLQEDVYRSYTFAYATAGLYARFLEPWLRRFGRQRVLPVLSEDLHNDPTAVMQEVCRFLEVDDDFGFDFAQRLNVAGASRFGLLPLLWRTPEPIKRIVKATTSSRVRGSVQQYIHEKDTKEVELPQLEHATAAWLRTRFADDIERLQTITGRELSAWTAVV